MTDFFATLELQRRPWVEEEELKQAFFRLSSICHPDQPTGDAAKFEAINTAWITLKDPVTCLKHWLELESPGFTASTTPPAELINLFMEAGSLQQSLAAFDQEYTSAISALSRSLLEPRRLALKTKSGALLEKLQLLENENLTAVRSTNPSIESLQKTYTSLSYLRKWRRAFSSHTEALG